MSDSQAKFYKKLFGKIGEKKAEKYLLSLGYTFVARNYTTPCGEADLIFLDGETVVFVEVKSRKSDVYGQPSQAVNYKKQQKYVGIAKMYMQKAGEELLTRFDIVEIKKDEINHIKGAFTA